MKKLILYLGILTILISSCDLKYTPPLTPLTKEKNRQDSIQNYLRTSFQKDSTTYESIAFSKSQMIKPISFKALDSLYAIKYEYEIQNIKDRNLEENIQIQRQIVLNDTNSIIYIENHLFSLLKNDELVVYTGAFECDQQAKIRNVKINTGINIPSEKIDLYKRYLFEESIINPGFEPISTEVALYKSWKEREFSLEGKEREDFINHVLNLMTIIQTERTTKTLTLVQNIVLQKLNEIDPSERIHSEFVSVEETIILEEGKEVLTGYKVVYTYKTLKDNLSYTSNYQFILNPLMQITSYGLF